MSRRERLRAETANEIKAHAREQLAAGGAAALSLNGIARTMGLTTPALYHYFRNRDELITALIVDAYTDLAVTLENAVAAHPAEAVTERLLAAMRAYRNWALAHRTDFLLINGDPIPGYHAPIAETTSPAQRVFAVFIQELAAAAATGILVPTPRFGTQAPHLHLFPNDVRGTQIDPALALIAITGWTRMHGVVMLELVGQLGIMVGDPDRFYHDECRALLLESGLHIDEP